jgi:hypothetical protein
MQKRLDTTERILQLRKEQDLHLRDSIFQATREVIISARFSYVCFLIPERLSVRWGHQ